MRCDCKVRYNRCNCGPIDAWIILGGYLPTRRPVRLSFRAAHVICDMCSERLQKKSAGSELRQVHGKEINPSAERWNWLKVTKSRVSVSSKCSGIENCKVVTGCQILKRSKSHIYLQNADFTFIGESCVFDSYNCFLVHSSSRSYK